MKWSEIRQRYPNEWLLVEAIQAHSQNGKRILESMLVVDTFSSGADAWKAYAKLHKTYPERELVPVHTSKEQIELNELHWFGIRSQR